MPVRVTNVTLDTARTALSWTVKSVDPAVSATAALWWFALVIAPPTDGWLGLDARVMTDRTLVLRVMVSCDDWTSMDIVVSVPAPGASRDITGEVKAVVGYSQVASVIAGGASSGSSLGRVMATRSMVMCDADAAVGGGVVDLGLTICGGDAGSALVSAAASVAARSAVVSNAALVFVVFCLLMVLSATWFAALPGGGSTLLDAMTVFVLPSSLLPVWVAVLPTTAAATAMLIGRIGDSRCVATDAVLSALGVVLSLTPSAALTALWITKAYGPGSPWSCVQTCGEEEVPAGPAGRNERSRLL
jgi:hypothetical protein